MTDDYEQERGKKWLEMLNWSSNLDHVPNIRDRTRKEYLRLLAHGMDCVNALEEALIKHAYYKDERPLPMAQGADLYEDILEGDRIWDTIQKTSER